MTCNCNDNYGCGGACDPGSSNTAIKQAVNDALAAEKVTLEGYVTEAALSATEAGDSAADAASSASAGAQSQANAETAANTATQAAISVTNTAIVLEETAERIEHAQDLLEEQISALQTKPVYFEVSTPTSSLVLPETESVFNVRSIYVASARQAVGYGFTFDKETRTVTLAEEITAEQIAETEEGYILVEVICDVYSSDDPTSFPIILASNAGANNVGTSTGDTVETRLTTLDSQVDPTLRANLSSSDGAKLIGGLNYVTPEMSGFVTGVGNADDDTAAFQWALNQNAKQVVLDSTKTYNIQPGVIQYTGKINVDAGTAKIVCDGIAVDIIDGAGSVWKGGNLLSKTTPWTVVYDEDFNIVESGNLGYGRMPYQDDANVDSSHYYQQICCSLVFRSSTSDVLDGLSVSGVIGSYAAVVAAGFKNTKWVNNKIRGGALAGAIMVLNDCEFPVTVGFGWNSGNDVSYANPFKWSRGSNHSFVNCDLFESRQMGLFVTGSDYVTISNVNTYDNAESGVQTGQYSAAYPQESIVCKYVTQTGCKSWGNYYDGLDHAAVTNGANGPYLDKHLKLSGNQVFNNRATGMVVQGNFLQINGNEFYANGTHGISMRDSSVVSISRNQCTYNGRLAGGYQILAVGSDMSVDDNTVLNTSQTDSHLVNISIGLQTQKQFGVKFKNTPLSTRSSPKTVIGIGVLMTGDEKTSDGSNASYSGVRVSGYIPAPIAGVTSTKSVASEAGAVAAWKHPATGAWMRLFTNDLTGATNTGFSFGYNWGKNSANASGYWDNAGIGGTLVTFNPTSIVFNIHAAGSMTSVGGATISSTSLRPNIDNTISGGQSSFRFTQLFATNSTIGTCDADEKMEPVNPNEAEINAFYEISLLPWVWQWLEKYQVEGDNARLHSGPTVQAAIAIMDKHGLDWTRYAAFCYNEWDAWEGGIDPVTMIFVPAYDAGHRYGFRKEELLLWMLRAIVEKQKSIEARLAALEGK